MLTVSLWAPLSYFFLLSGWCWPLRTEPTLARVPFRDLRARGWLEALLCGIWSSSELIARLRSKTLHSRMSHEFTQRCGSSLCTLSRRGSGTTHGCGDAWRAWRPPSSLYFQGPRDPPVGRILGSTFPFNFPSPASIPSQQYVLSPLLVFTLHFSYSLCGVSMLCLHSLCVQAFWQVLCWGLQALGVEIAPEGKKHSEQFQRPA